MIQFVVNENNMSKIQQQNPCTRTCSMNPLLISHMNFGHLSDYPPIIFVTWNSNRNSAEALVFDLIFSVESF